MSSLQSRVLVAVIGVPVLVWVVLWAPPLVMLVALCLLAGIGGMELQRCVSGAPRSELVGMSAIFPVFMVAWYYERPEHVVVLVVVELVVFFGYAIVKGVEIKFNQIMAALFGGTFIGYSFAAFLRLEAAGIQPKPNPDGWQWYGETVTAWTMPEKVKQKYASRGFYFDEDRKLLDQVAATNQEI